MEPESRRRAPGACHYPPAMSASKVRLIARVECWAGSRGEERPAALAIGGHRIGVVDILERALVTSPDAGEPVVARFLVELEDGAVVALERTLPDGQWRCWRIQD
jgi:hypothetical protein